MPRDHSGSGAIGHSGGRRTLTIGDLVFVSRRTPILGAVTKGDVGVPTSQDAAVEAATVRLERDRKARAEQIERDAQITLKDRRMIDARFFAELELVTLANVDLAVARRHVLLTKVQWRELLSAMSAVDPKADEARRVWKALRHAQRRIDAVDRVLVARRRKAV